MYIGQSLSNAGLGSGLGRPSNLYLAVLCNTVPKIEIDEALIGDSSLSGHALKVGNDVFGEPHCDGLL